MLFLHVGAFLLFFCMWVSFLSLWGAFFGLAPLPPPPKQKFQQAPMIIWYCCALVRGMRACSPKNSFNIVRLEYIFDQVSAFAKCSGGGGGCTPEKLF